MASDEMLQAVTKHVTGANSAQEFSQLKERFEGYNYMSPSAAAALGYLIAKDELEAAKEEEKRPDVYDEVVGVIKDNFYQRYRVSPCMAADEIFTLIYKWLNQSLLDNDWDPEGATIGNVKRLFQPFIITEAER